VISPGLRINARSAQRAEKLLGGAARAYVVGTRRALNRAADSGRVHWAKAINQILTLKQAAIKPRLWIDRATDKNLVASIGVGRKAVPLIEFPVNFLRKSGGGVSLRVKRNHARERLRHAFIATMPSNHTGVFEGKTAGGSRVVKIIPGKRGPRRYYPIKELFSSTVIDVAGDEFPAVQRHVRGFLLRTAEHEIDFEVGKLLR